MNDRYDQADQAMESSSAPGAGLRKSDRGGRAFAVLLAALGFGAIGYFLLVNDGSQIEPSETLQGEEFVPIRSRQREEYVPPEPPPVPTVTVPTAPPPAPAEPTPAAEMPLQAREPDCEENAADKLIHPKCIGIEREKKLLERIRSNIVVIDSGINPAAAAGGMPSSANSAGAMMDSNNEVGGRGGRDGAPADDDRAFLDEVGGAGFETSAARINKRSDAWIPQGTMIHGTLETAINSDLAGMVKAVVRQDVYSFDGRHILIPAGSWLIGDYKTGVSQGQQRLLIVWTRMIRADGVSIELGSFGTDALGRSGLTGRIDKKFWERFGPPALLTVVGGLSQYVAGLGNHQNDQKTTTIDTTTGNVISLPSTANSSQEAPTRIAVETIAAAIQQMASEAFKNGNGVQPTIQVDQGADVDVFVTRDLDFSDFYPDPVRREFERIRKSIPRK